MNIGVLLCVDCLDKAIVSVHCCAKAFLCIQVKILIRVPSITLSSAMSVVGINHIGTHPACAIINFQRSNGADVLAKIHGPSERSDDCWSISYVRYGTVGIHDCALMACMSCSWRAHSSGPHCFKAKCCHQQKWRTVPVSQENTHHTVRLFGA